MCSSSVASHSDRRAALSALRERDDRQRREDCCMDHTDPPPEYRARRETIAALAAGSGAPPLDIDYTEAENSTWSTVCESLRPEWDRHASAEVLDGREALGLPTDRVPQLSEVNARLGPISGFRFVAVPGLVPATEFFVGLGDRRFSSTQYVRWEGSPLYTPEPDVIHELIGHAHLLACPRLAELHVLAGQCIGRLGEERSRQAVADVFWFSAEFGVVDEHDEWKAYGAGLLSSFGELRSYPDNAEVRPLDIAAMATLPYEIDHYQPVLFGGRSIDEIIDVVGGFFASADDASIDAMLRGSRDDPAHARSTRTTP